jgi:hypothetical protein
MNLNYNVNHALFNHEALSSLSNKPRIITWLVWSQLIHLCWHREDKQWAFRQGDFCRDLMISESTCASALKYLIDQGLIKLVKPYSKTGNQPGIYALKGASIRIAQNQYQKQGKPVSPRDRVNKLNKFIRDESDLSIISPNKKEEDAADPTVTIETKETWEL